MSNVHHEYFARYQHYSHRDLYNRVTQAVPTSATHAAERWGVVQTVLDQLSQDLTTDVATVAPHWHGDGSGEFQDRMGIVSTYSADLATDAGNIASGLHQLTSPISTAVSDAHADNPANTEGHSNMLKLALTGAVTLNPIAAAGGGLLGMVLDKDEADKAHDRMIQTVSTLAATYDVVTQRTWPTEITPPPPGLPGGPAAPVDTGGGPVTGVGHWVGHATSSFTQPGAPAAPAPPSGGIVAQPPAVHANPEVDSLLLAGTGTMAGLGVVGAIFGAGAPPAIPNLGPAGAPGKGGLGATFGKQGAPAVLGRDGEAHLSASRTAAPPAENEASTHQGGPVDPKARANVAAEGEDANPAGRPRLSSTQGGQAGEDGQAHTAVTRGSTTGMPGAEEEGANRSGYLGNRGATGVEDEDDERLTWLTEDEMVWGQTKGTPPILGG